jgi:hypothetical protein
VGALSRTTCALFGLGLVFVVFPSVSRSALRPHAWRLSWSLAAYSEAGPSHLRQRLRQSNVLIRRSPLPVGDWAFRSAVEQPYGLEEPGDETKENVENVEAEGGQFTSAPSGRINRTR